MGNEYNPYTNDMKGKSNQELVDVLNKPVHNSDMGMWNEAAYRELVVRRLPVRREGNRFVVDDPLPEGD